MTPLALLTLALAQPAPTARPVAPGKPVLTKVDSSADPAAFAKLFTRFGAGWLPGRTAAFEPGRGVVFHAPKGQKMGAFGLHCEGLIPGDFWFEARYELTAVTDPVDDHYGVWLGLALWGGPDVGRAMVVRGVARRGSAYYAERGAPVDVGGRKETRYATSVLPTNAKSGRVAARRSGSEIILLAADGDAELKVVARHAFTDRQDVSVDLFADTGRTSAEVRGRLTDVKLLTGDDIPGAELRKDPKAVQKTELPGPEQLAQERALAPEPERRPAPGDAAPARSGALLPLVTLLAGFVGGVLVGRFTAKRAAAVAALALAAGPAPARDFDMAADPAGFAKVFRPDGDRSGGRTAVLDAAGLTVTIPATKNGSQLGVAAPMTLSGDFQLEADYELPVFPEKRDAADGGYGVMVSLIVAASGHGDASVNRGVYPTAGGERGGHAYLAGRAVPIKGKLHFGTAERPTSAKSGRLGLRRTGAEIRCLAADGAGELREFYRYPFTAEPVTRVLLVATNGNSPVAVTARLTNAKLRSGAALPPEPPKGEPALARMALPTAERVEALEKLEAPPEPAVRAADGTPAPAPARSAALLPAAALGVGLVLGVLIGRATKRAAPLAALLLAAGAAPAQDVTKIDMAGDPAGFQKLFKVYGGGGGAERDQKFDPAKGLSIDIPKGKHPGNFGRKAAVHLPGDFQIEARYDVKVLAQAKPDYYGAALGLKLEEPDGRSHVTVNRAASQGGVGIYATRAAPVGGPQLRYASSVLPTRGLTGRLGIRREGGEVRLLGADGAGELRELGRYPFPARPDLALMLFADSGGSEAEVRGWLFDLIVRTGTLPPAPPKEPAAEVRSVLPAPGSAAATAPSPRPRPAEPEQAGEPAPTVQEAPARSVWLFPAVLAGLALVAGVIFGRRTRPAAAIFLTLAGGSAPAQTAPVKVDMAADPEGFLKLFRPFGDASNGRSALFDPKAGLTIGLPQRKQEGAVGYRADVRVAGDFQAEVSYELLAIPPKVSEGFGVTVDLRVEASDGAAGGAWVNRGGYSTPKVRANRGLPKPRGGGTHFAWADRAAKGAAGRMGLRRVGSEIVYLAADDPAAPLEEVFRMPFTDKPVRQVALSGNTGGGTYELRARLSGFRLLSGADLPPEPKRSASPAYEVVGMPDPDAAPAPAPAPVSPPASGDLGPATVESAPPAAPTRSGGLLPFVTHAAAAVAGVLLGRATARRSPGGAP